MDIRRSYLPGFERTNRDILDSIDLLRRTDLGRPGKSSVGGWHSHDLSTAVLPGFDALSAFLRKEVGGFDELWAIVNGKGHFNRQHKHNPGRVSAAYYIQVPRPAAAIVFPGVRGRRIEPEPGLLLTFDGSLTHSVEVNESDGLRVSISCNFLVSSRSFFRT
jgi:hypothetical protein